MLKKFLLAIAFVFVFSLNAEVNKIKDNKVTIEKIRQEVTNLEKSIFGRAKVTLENAPVLYSVIQKLADKIDLDVPKINISKGLFTPQTNNEERLAILLEYFPLDFILPYVFTKSVDLEVNRISNINIEFIINILLSLMFTKFFENLLLGQKKTNAFAINGFSENLVCIGSDFINNFDLIELENVIAHEFAHLKHNHSLKLKFLIYPLLYLNMNPNTKAKWNNGFLIYLFIAFVSRLFEMQADLTAVKVTNNPVKMITALQKMDNINLLKIFKLFNIKIKNNRDQKNQLNLSVKKTENIKITTKAFNIINRLLSIHPTFEQRVKYLTEISKNLS